MTEPTHASAVHPSYYLVPVILHFQPYSTYYSAIWINSCLRSFFCSQMKNAKGNHKQIDIFSCQQRWMVCNERHCKSMKNALYIYCGMPKGTSQAEVTLNSEKIKPMILTYAEWSVSQSDQPSVLPFVSQYKTPLNNFSHSLATLWRYLIFLDLKPCLGLVLPN